MVALALLAAIFALPVLTSCDDGSWALKPPASASTSATLQLSASSLNLVVSSQNATKPTISASSLGFITANGGSFTSNLKYVNQTSRTISKSYQMKTGKRHQRQYVHAEYTFQFRSDTQSAKLVVILAQDGIAHRWILDQSPGKVTKETARWVFSEGGKAWLQESLAPNYESEWKEYTIANSNGGATLSFPALFRPSSSSSYVLLSETDLDGRYAGSHLTHSSSTPLEYGLELHQNTPVNAAYTGLATPWRVAIIGDLPTIVSSSLIDDLAPESRLSDTSWVSPGISSWSWLTDWSSPKNETRQYDFVNLSARNKWKYILLDEGWTEQWAPRVVSYAKTKGISTILWFHHQNLLTKAQRDTWLPKIVSWGVAGVKVDFMESDSQDKFQWYDAMIEDAAKYKLMINFHGATIPHGNSRTWPHIMSFEAVRGEENGQAPIRSLIVPFTRNVIGSMDFTPVVLSRGNGNSSRAQEVAMAIVYESGWQHMADNPESYASNPIAEKFLNDLPADWDDTVLIDGEPAQRVIMARKKGSKWYIGGMKQGAAGKMTVNIGKVLGSGTWNVYLVKDGQSGGQVVATVLGDENRTAKAGDVWEIQVAQNGGFAAIATPA